MTDPAAPARDGGSLRAAAGVTAGAALLRLTVAALTPVFPDETYYWEWSRHMAPSYFDHPPMIALLVRAGTALFGATPLGVRFGAVLAGGAGAWLLCLTARRIADSRAAFITAVLFAVMPLAAAGLVLATPDAPLLCAAAATLYALVRVMEKPPGTRASLGWWAVAGVMLGLAFLAKYTAVLVPLGAVIAFLARRELRPRLAEPGPWVATVIAAALFTPVIWWNATHQWVSFAFQLQHGLGGSLDAAFGRELEMIGGQMALVSPILFVLCAIAVFRALHRKAHDAHGDARALLAIIALTVFAFFMYSATRRRVEANWPAPSYLPAIVLLAAASATETWTRWLRAGTVLAALISLVAYVNAFIPVLPVPAPRDPASRAAGFEALGLAVSDALDAAGNSRAGTAVFAAADRYQEASELAFHLRGNPTTYALDLYGRANQYDLWPGFADQARRGDGLIVALDDAEKPAAIDSLAPHFRSVERGQAVRLSRGDALVKQMRIWRLNGWLGTWPNGRLRSAP